VKVFAGLCFYLSVGIAILLLRGYDLSNLNLMPFDSLFWNIFLPIAIIATLYAWVPSLYKNLTACIFGFSVGAVISINLSPMSIDF